MNREEAIRAKALELAILTFNKETGDFFIKNAERMGRLEFSPTLERHAEFIADWIKGSPGDQE